MNEQTSFSAFYAEHVFFLLDKRKKALKAINLHFIHVQIKSDENPGKEKVIKKPFEKGRGAGNC